MKDFNKDFNKMIVNSEDVLGEGKYRSERGYIFIETKNKEMKDYFKKIRDEKVVLESVELFGDEVNALFSGSFICQSMFYNSNTLFMDIHLKEIK